MKNILLEARQIRKYFPVKKGLIFSRTLGHVKAVNDISFSVYKGDTFSLVGESGCGKTTTLKLILLLEKLTKGSIFFQGKDISTYERSELKQFRRSVQAMFQDPYGSLNPRMRVGDIIAEPMEAIRRDELSYVRCLISAVYQSPHGSLDHGINIDKNIVKRVYNVLGNTKNNHVEKVAEMLQEVGLNPASAELYPHEFSGGQRQRIAFARAMAINPELVLLDEPVSALDVSVRAQLMNLLMEVQEKKGVTYLMIAHDLATVRHLSNRMAVMYLGKVVETGDSESIYGNPCHPYTQALFSAALPSNPHNKKEEINLPGEVPSPIDPPSGCTFHPRCFYKKDVCIESEPHLSDAENDHQVACHFWADVS